MVFRSGVPNVNCLIFILHQVDLAIIGTAVPIIGT